MKKLLLASVLSVLALFCLGCGDEGKSQLRVVHASPDAPNVDVYVDGKIVLNNVAYGSASDYLAVHSGTRRIGVTPTGTKTNVIDVKTDLANKKHYTVLAAGLVANIAPLQLTDDTTAPGSGNIRLRVVHGSPSAGSVDVYVTAPGADLTTATPVLSNLAFKAISDYLEVAAGSYEIRVTLTGTKTVAIDSGSVTLSAGQVRTVVALDAAGGGGPFTALVLADLN